MSAISQIQWTDATWNPCLGCSKVSPGCRSCYAILDVHRMAGNPNPAIKAANSGLTVIQNGHPNWTGEVRLIPERLDIPLRRRKPTRYFVNSLSDLFHESLPNEAIDPIFAVMALCPQHTFQVLTKRAERMREWFDGIYVTGGPETFSVRRHGYRNPDRRHGDRFIQLAWGERWPLPNVWLGVSVEDRERMARIDVLRKTPAAVRLLSLEPLLEDLGTLDLTAIHWVIVGGESGKDARPCHPDWVRSIRDQCRDAGVAFFFKQWGNHLLVPKYEGSQKMVFRNLGKKAAGRVLDGRTWDDMPSVGARQSQTPRTFLDTRETHALDVQAHGAKQELV